MKRFVLLDLSFVVALALVVLAAGTSLRAADKQAKEKPAVKEATAAEPAPPKRLPDHYAAVIDDAQRDEIYAIQAKYAADIEKAQAQLNAVLGKRNAEIRAVLTPEQQIKVDALADEAAKKQKDTAKPSDEKADGASVIDAMNLKALEGGKAKKGK